MSDITTTIIIAVPILLISIALHEMMHAFTSYWLGDDTAKHQGRISLNPFVHIDPFLTIGLPLILAAIGAPIFGAAKPVNVDTSRVKYNEFGMAIIAAVGPLTNLILAAIGALLFNNIEVFQSGFAFDVIRMFILINVGFFVFNSIPFPPLDGSRILYAFAPRPVQEFMEMIESYGLVAFAIFIFIFYQYLSPIINWAVSAVTQGLLLL